MEQFIRDDDYDASTPPIATHSPLIDQLHENISYHQTVKVYGYAINK